MKIVIDARIIYTSTGRYVFKLLENLQAIDHDNDYVVLLRKKDFDKWQPVNPRFTKVVSDYATYTFGEQLGFCWQLYKLKANIVHFAYHSRPLLYFRPSITTIHDLALTRIKNYDMPVIVFEIKQLIFKIALHIMARTSKKIITPTQFVRNDLLDYSRIKPDKITVTYESADKIKEPPAPIEHLANKPFLLNVGQSSPYKNVPRIIEAQQQLLAKHPALYFVHAGKKDDFTKQYEADARERSLKQVEFLGFVSDGELRWLYENAAVYVMASFEEGFGLTGLEALHHGTLVASSNASCLPEVYQDAVNYFNPNDSTDMARAIGEILDSKSKVKELAAKSNRLIKKYSWKQMAEQTLKVYKSFLP